MSLNVEKNNMDMLWL